MILHPIQIHTHPHEHPRVNTKVTERAYEVYCHLHGPQPAMMDLEGRGCRGGFGATEIIAFLYAHSFPQAEWRARTKEAFVGMQGF
jgi:hypothetical protein